MDNHYGGIIWTNHALQRLRERGIKQGDAWATWRKPDRSRYEDATWVYTRTINHQDVEVVAKKNERGEWIVLSVWSKPVSRQYTTRKQSSFWPRFIKILQKLFR